MDMPIGFFAALEQYSTTAFINALDRYAYGSFTSAIAVQNQLIAAGASPVFGTPPLRNQQVNWMGSCYTLNIIPVYRGVWADIQDESNVGQMSVLADQLCRNNNVTTPQVITAVDGTESNSVLFSGLALACSGYAIPSITTIYNDPSFSVKSNYQYSARVIPSLTLPNYIVFNMMELFGWTRLCVFGATEPNVPGLVQFLQSEAYTTGIELTVQTIPPNLNDCSAFVSNVVAQDLRIIYFLGPPYDFIACLREVIVKRQLLLQNYVLIFSFQFMSNLNFQMANLAPMLNISASQLRGVLGLNPVTALSTIGLLFYQTLAANYSKFGYSAAAASPQSAAFFLQNDAVTLSNQGVSGMLGARLAQTLPALAANPLSTTVPSPPPSTMNAVQNLTNTLLSLFSTNGAVTSSALTFSASVDGLTYTVGVPFSSLFYNTSAVYYWFTNSSGASMLSGLGGVSHGVHSDQGDPLALTNLVNFDGVAMYSLSQLNTVKNTYIILNNTVVWPNAAILQNYATGWPSDRQPTVNITLSCVGCGGALTPIAVSDTMYALLSNVRAAYELDLSPDNPSVYSIAPVCDGTAPVVVSLVPLIDSLSSNLSSSNIPILGQAAAGTVTVYGALLIDQLKQLYSAAPDTFATTALPPIPSLSALSSLTTTVQVVAATNGGAGAFVLEMLVNCNNQANNASAVLRIVTIAEADIYTPATAAQAALIALNGFALALVGGVATLISLNRYDRAVFSSSYPFLLLILVGFLLLFASSLLSILDATAAICQAKMITFHLGFTIALGSIFVKNYRLHRIFNSKDLLNISISTRTLLGAVATLLLIDAIVIACWIEVSGITIESDAKPHCYTSGNGANGFPAVFTALKGVIIFFGIYLTLKVRAVPANFNESRFIAIVIYNTAVLSVVYIVVFFAFSLEPKSLSIFTSVVLFLGAFANFLVFYLPKLLALRHLYLKNDSASTSNKSLHSATGRLKSKRSSVSKDTVSKSNIGSTSHAPGGATQSEDIDSGHKDETQKKERTVESVAARITKLKGKFLQTIHSTKKGDGELTRLCLRCDEMKILIQDSYDKLRTYAIELKLNCERMRGMLKGGSVTEGEKTGHLGLVKEAERLIELPFEQIDVEENGQTYTVLDQRSVNRQRSNVSTFGTSQMAKSALQTKKRDPQVPRGTIMATVSDRDEIAMEVSGATPRSSAATSAKLRFPANANANSNPAPISPAPAVSLDEGHRPRSASGQIPESEEKKGSITTPRAPIFAVAEELSRDGGPGQASKNHI